LDIRRSKRIVRMKILWCEFCGFPQGRDSLIIAPLHDIDDAQFLVHGMPQSAVGLLLEPLMVGSYRFIMQSFHRVSTPHLEVSSSIARFCLDNGSIGCNGLIVAALIERGISLL
jgi:hypothetical protein